MEHLAVLYKQHALRGGSCLDGVRDHEDSLSEGVHLAEQAQQFVGGLRIERARGLVRQNHARLGYQRAGDRRPLLLAAGYLVGVLLEQLRYAETFCYRLKAGVHLIVAPAREVDVILDRERVEKIELLEHEA